MVTDVPTWKEPTLTALSVASTCSSTFPSATAVVLNAAVVGVHVVPPSVEYSYATDETPEPFVPFGSLVAEVRLTVARRYGPGSLIVAFGAVLSTSLFGTGFEAAWLPATS